MRPTRPPPPHSPRRPDTAKPRPIRPGGLIGLLAVLLLVAGPAAAQEAVEPPKVALVAESQNLTAVPDDVAGLLDLDARIRRVVDKILPATVGLLVGPAQGSGVIISADGLVLTAAHVSGPPGQRVRVIMPDGTQYRAVSLGRNQGLDDGLIRIVDDKADDLPFVPLGQSKDLPVGTWTVALGHPGGYQQDRPPVVRVGRLLVNGDDLLVSDNTLVGGDSGGPLFDLDGRLIGIHSRIGDRIQQNIHVPVDRFLGDWSILAESRDEGGTMPRWMRDGPQRATDGMRFDTTDLTTRGARVVDMAANGPGDAAGIQINDRVVAFDGKPVQNGQDLVIKRLALRPGEAVTYRVLRDGRESDVRVTPVPLGDQRDLNDPNDPRQGRGRDDPNRPVLGFRPGESDAGVLVQDVRPGSPAERAGFRDGDVLLEIDGMGVGDAVELGLRLRRVGAGNAATATLLRDGQQRRVQVTVGRLGDVFGDGQ